MHEQILATVGGSCMSQFKKIFFQMFHFLTAPRIAIEKFAVILFLTLC